MNKLKKEAGNHYIYYFHYLGLSNLNYFTNDLKRKNSDYITNILIENYIKQSKDIILFLNKVNNI